VLVESYAFMTMTNNGSERLGLGKIQMTTIGKTQGEDNNNKTENLYKKYRHPALPLNTLILNGVFP
jgi:hypothetical protein